MINLRKIALYALGPLGVGGISFLVIPVLAWKYSPDVVADYAILQAIIAFGVLFFTFGSDQAFFRNYYETKEKGKLFKNVLLISTFPMIIILSILLYFWEFWGDYLYTKNSIWFVFLTLICVFFAVVNRLFSLIQRLENQAFLFSLSQFLPKLIFFIAILIPVITDNPNFYWIVGGQVVGYLIVNLYFFYINNKILKSSFYAFVDNNLIKKILNYGLPLLVSNILFWLLRYADRFYVKYLSNNNELAMYALATSIAGAFAILGTLFNTIWMPKALKLYEENNLTVDYLEKISLLLSLLGSAIVILAFLFKGLIGGILPPIYYNIVYILPLMILPSLYYTIAEVLGIGISLSKKTSKMVFVSALSALLHCALSFLLIPKYGALGAAQAISMSFLFFLMLKLYYSNKVWIKIKSKIVIFINIMLFIFSVWSGIFYTML